MSDSFDDIVISGDDILLRFARSELWWRKKAEAALEREKRARDEDVWAMRACLAQAHPDMQGLSAVLWDDERRACARAAVERAHARLAAHKKDRGRE